MFVTFREHLSIFIATCNLTNFRMHRCTMHVKAEMARTNGSTPRRVPRPVAKAIRLPSRKKNPSAVPLLHRFRPGMRARMEVCKWRYPEPEKLLILLLSFERIVREVAQEHIAAPRFQQKGIETLQYAAESRRVKLCKDANLLTRHAKRINVYPSYLDGCAERLSGASWKKINFTRFLHYKSEIFFSRYLNTVHQRVCQALFGG